MNNNVINEVKEYFIDNKKIEIKENFELQIWPQKIAIIAPVSGKYSKIGRSLINGIEMSIENLNKVGISIQTKIYDSGEQGLSIKKISNDINQSDYDYVIGPILKKNISTYSNESSSNAKKLILNKSEKINFNKNKFYFGLFPEDDIQCIIKGILANNYQRGVMIYPKNRWGERLLISFQDSFYQFDTYKKEILEISYEKQKKEIDKKLKEIFHIEESYSKRKYIKSLLDINFNFVPHIRDDIDFIFSIGTSDDLKQIKPKLDFYYAENIPVFSTSHIFSGVINSQKDKDLNDIVFCDIPWLFDKKNKRILKNLVLSDQRKNFLRFVALGMDSINIYPFLDKLKEDQQKFIKLRTGKIYISTNGIIKRDLNYLKFKNGRPRLINIIENE
ncbi:MAG: penicillin-binding protein activator [Pseudomonadota bacterium]|nr:penicillin-binding protein activator [Pseudomonadota bacterium]